MVEIIVRCVNIVFRQIGNYHPAIMTANEYKAAIAALGMDHHMADKALEIGPRTSQRYAFQGAPRIIALALKALAIKSKGKNAA